MHDAQDVASALDIAIETILTKALPAQERLAQAWLERILHVFPLSKTIPAELRDRLHALRDRMTERSDVRTTCAALTDDQAQEVIDEIRAIRDKLETLQ